MTTDDGLFLLIRLGLGTSIDTDCPHDLLSLSLDDWKSLMELAQRQSVCAIAVDGIQNTVEREGNIFADHYGQKQWTPLVLEWSGVMLTTEQANEHQTKVMNRLANAWEEGGCKTMLMKGQSNGLFYPKPNHRSPGDIDVYLFDGYEKAHDIARQEGAQINDEWYKHSEITYYNEVFENHRFLVPTRQGKCSKRLDEELKEEIREKKLPMFPNSKVLVPTPMFNAKFLTFHSCAHFLAEGLRLKQLLDWAMFLKSEQEKVNWAAFYDFCDKYHYHRFADAATTIAVKYFGVKIHNSKIVAESPFAEKIMQSALYDDDFVYGSGKGDWYNRFHLVTNLFRYRWKYRDICQQSPLRKLYYHVTGFFFKTE